MEDDLYCLDSLARLLEVGIVLYLPVAMMLYEILRFLLRKMMKGRKLDFEARR